MKFVVDKNNPLVAEAFGPLGEVVLLGTREITPDTVRDADVLIVRSETRVNGDLLEGSRVRFVGTATIGTDHIDTDYLAARNIGFASAPGSNANSVREYIIAALLSLAETRGFTLKGKTIGIVGVGNVGGKVADAARILGMDVLLNDPPRARAEGGPFVDLASLMDADIITVHVPLTRSGPDATYHLFGRDRFLQMKPGLIFLNTARGGVVETRALKGAVLEGRLGAAVLDVWENEPYIDAELLANASIGTAHIAGYSFDGKLNAVKMIRDAVCRHFDIASSWTPVGLPPGLPAFRCNGHSSPGEPLLNRIVQQAYNIGYDDGQLRRLLTVPVDGRAEYFRALRSGYRTRREFSSMVVQLSEDKRAFGATVEALGFSVDYFNHAQQTAFAGH